MTSAINLSLRSRFILLIVAILLAGTAIGYGTFLWRSQDTIHTLGGWFAERNALYEKSRIVRALGREVVLVQKMAKSAVIADWVRNETDPELRAAAEHELEGFRDFFASGNFFIALARSGHYYFTERSGTAVLERPTYRLDRNLGKDAWFYLTLENVRDHQLNVDTDRHLKTTKLWINGVMRQDDEALAVMGTGLDLGRFIDDVMTDHREGVVNILFDPDGAIQAHRDINAIDFGSIRRPVTGEARSTLYHLLNPADATELKLAVERLLEGRQAQILDLVIDGQRSIGGLTDIPEIGWFLLTLTNPESALDQDILLIVALVFGLTLGASLLLAWYSFDRSVLRPLDQLDAAASRLAAGHFDVSIDARGGREIGRVVRTFEEMSARIRGNTEQLERQVAARTYELAQLAFKDHLTGHLNRRGLFENLTRMRSQVNRNAASLGLIMLDIDHFKACNDTYGHEAGDRALVHLADWLRQELRGHDLCSRWGGEEFLIAAEVDAVDGHEQLRIIAEKLRRKVKGSPIQEQGRIVSLSISLGACLVGADEPTESAIGRADAALYRAKAAGRDQVMLAASVEATPPVALPPD